jgi:hypothetical protein
MRSSDKRRCLSGLTSDQHRVVEAFELEFSRTGLSRWKMTPHSPVHMAVQELLDLDCLFWMSAMQTDASPPSYALRFALLLPHSTAILPPHPCIMNRVDLVNMTEHVPNLTLKTEISMYGAVVAETQYKLVIDKVHVELKDQEAHRNVRPAARWQ